MRDIFISYSHVDSDWVRKELLVALEDRNFSVMIDFRDFTTGAFGVQEMERGVLETRRTILVLTPGYVASEWCSFENVMAQTLDPGAANRKIIPVLRRKCDIPLRLRIMHYRDLTTDKADEWELLFRDLV
jgi:TIR domain